MWILRNLTEYQGEGEGKKKNKLRREPKHKRFLKTENKLRVDGGWEGGRWVRGIEEGTCWDEHWVLYGNQFDNKFHIKNNKKNRCILQLIQWHFFCFEKAVSDQCCILWWFGHAGIEEIL